MHPSEDGAQERGSASGLSEAGGDGRMLLPVSHCGEQRASAIQTSAQVNKFFFSKTQEISFCLWVPYLATAYDKFSFIFRDGNICEIHSVRLLNVENCSFLMLHINPDIFIWFLSVCPCAMCMCLLRLRGKVMSHYF